MVYDERMQPIAGYGYRQGSVGAVGIDKPDMPYHAFHNHGSSQTFSFDDILMFSELTNMLSLTVIGNRGNLFILLKGENVNISAFKIQLLEFYNEIICVLNGYSFTIRMLSDIRSGSLPKSIYYELSENQKSKLATGLLSHIERLLKGANKYGIKYYFSAP